jgi:heme/copper-type cytochrome/quinol oxidase subunit 2
MDIVVSVSVVVSVVVAAMVVVVIAVVVVALYAAICLGYDDNPANTQKTTKITGKEIKSGLALRLRITLIIIATMSAKKTKNNDIAMPHNISLKGAKSIDNRINITDNTISVFDGLNFIDTPDKYYLRISCI